ncbi:uncharacterized protein [Apostichopus japonicus]|uniref:uncharacterized protein n=1 Tax=Stichopus japonicus TaxID=307972 RepID=UPI003AB58D14
MATSSNYSELRAIYEYIQSLVQKNEELSNADVEQLVRRIERFTEKGVKTGHDTIMKQEKQTMKLLIDLLTDHKWTKPANLLIAYRDNYSTSTKTDGACDYTEVCKTHETNPIDLFCKVCAECICLQCLAEVHKGHDTIECSRHPSHVKALRKNIDDTKNIAAAKNFPCVDNDSTSTKPDGPCDYTEVCKRHEAHQIEFFCKDCAECICLRCLADAHKGHGTIECSEYKSHAKELGKQIDNIVAESDRCKDMDNYYNKLQEEVVQSYNKICGKITNDLLANLRVIDQHRLAEKDKMDRTSNVLKGKAVDLKEKLDSIYVYAGKSSEVWNTLNSLKQRINSLTEEPTVSAEYKKLLFISTSEASSFTIGRMIKGWAVGANWIRQAPDQFVRVFDERQSYGRIRLICTDPKQLDTFFWDYSITDSSSTKLVMSHRCIPIDGRKYMLMASGKKIIMIELIMSKMNCAGQPQEGVKSHKTINIECPRDDSHIIGINAHRPYDECCSEYLVSFSNCHMLYEYQIDETKPRRTLDCGGELGNCVSGFLDIAYREAMFIVIDSQTQTVTLLKNDQASRIFSPNPIRLKKVKSLIHPKGMQPLVVYSSSKKWLLIWQTIAATDQPISLNVGTFDMDEEGTFTSCWEGQCPSGSVPVGVCRYREKALICFSNGDVVNFRLPP